MRKSTIALISPLIIIACTRTQYIPAIRVEKTIDTVTRTIPDSATIRALFECDSLGRVRLREIDSYKGREASQNFNFADNELRIETRWRTQYIDRLREVHDTTTVVQEVQIVREIKHVPHFFWWCFAIAAASALWVVCRALRAVMRP